MPLRPRVRVDDPGSRNPRTEVSTLVGASSPPETGTPGERRDDASGSSKRRTRVDRDLVLSGRRETVKPERYAPRTSTQTPRVSDRRDSRVRPVTLPVRLPGGPKDRDIPCVRTPTLTVPRLHPGRTAPDVSEVLFGCPQSHPETYCLSHPFYPHPSSSTSGLDPGTQSTASPRRPSGRSASCPAPP